MRVKAFIFCASDNTYSSFSDKCSLCSGSCGGNGRWSGYQYDGMHGTWVVFFFFFFFFFFLGLFIAIFHPQEFPDYMYKGNG